MKLSFIHLVLRACRRFVKDPVVLIPNPTWGNHHNVVRDAGVRPGHPHTQPMHMMA